jgi:hypothetical protein
MVFFEPWPHSVDIKIIRLTKRIRTNRVFFDIVHNPPLQFNIVGFIEDQKIESSQEVSRPLGGYILAFFGNPLSHSIPEGYRLGCKVD